MSTKLAFYYGVGKFNKGDITATAYPHFLEEELHTITGDDGFERVKIANRVIDLGEMPDFSRLIEQKRAQLLEAAKARYEESVKRIESDYKAA